MQHVLLSPLGDEAIATDNTGGKHLIQLFPFADSPLDTNFAIISKQPGAASVVFEVCYYRAHRRRPLHHFALRPAPQVFTPPNRLLEELKRGAPLVAVVLPAWIYFGWHRLRDTFFEPTEQERRVEPVRSERRVDGDESRGPR